MSVEISTAYKLNMLAEFSIDILLADGKCR